MTTADSGPAADEPGAQPHICVCICTYKRPESLRRLLIALGAQDTAGRFTYSIVVADNDRRQSARAAVAEVAAMVPTPIHYRLEPQQNIALARNQAVAGSSGDFVAFIDDDELAPSDWLARLFAGLARCGADGVLGPVVPRFDEEPPDWVRRGRVFERPSPPSGTELGWKQTRTGNALLRRDIFADAANRFRPECGGGGEDVDFFRRMMAKGMRFVWCADAAVEEFVPAARCTRRYVLKRALLRGAAPHNRGWPVAVSVIAVPAYAMALPVLFACGQHVFMRYLIKECDHLGRLLALIARERMRRLALAARA